uniref:Uncharacterized protein n=1 Tax=Nelumbo nucifera TaxID=4432 RepID=A0A822YT99_NELNU|nr:TPA_asm: hypothetical protein HUJ06_005279 [Nelumbo nucifera]
MHKKEKKINNWTIRPTQFQAKKTFTLTPTNTNTKEATASKSIKNGEEQCTQQKLPIYTLQLSWNFECNCMSMRSSKGVRKEHISRARENPSCEEAEA